MFPSDMVESYNASVVSPQYLSDLFYYFIHLPPHNKCYMLQSTYGPLFALKYHGYFSDVAGTSFLLRVPILSILEETLQQISLRKKKARLSLPPHYGYLFNRHPSLLPCRRLFFIPSATVRHDARRHD